MRRYHGPSAMAVMGTVIKVGQPRIPWQYYKMMSADIFLWWVFLCAVSALNILAWALSAAYLRRRRHEFAAEEYASRRLQLLLSAGYVFGCAFRSVMPVYDVPRVCLFDSWLCSVVVGRSVATFAELCFAAQWALLLLGISRATGSGVGSAAAKVVVPFIAVAEIFSWYSVLTTSNLGHVIEESIWALSAGMLVLSLLWIWPRCSAGLRPLLAAWCAAGIAYVVFTQAMRNGDFRGLVDASGRWVVSRSWDVWKHEVAWMSLYFSVAVWLSIALIHAPVMARAPTAGESRSR